MYGWDWQIEKKIITVMSWLSRICCFHILVPRRMRPFYVTNCYTQLETNKCPFSRSRNRLNAFRFCILSCRPFFFSISSNPKTKYNHDMTAWQFIKVTYLFKNKMNETSLFFFRFRPGCQLVFLSRVMYRHKVGRFSR